MACRFRRPSVEVLAAPACRLLHHRRGCFGRPRRLEWWTGAGLMAVQCRCAAAESTTACDAGLCRCQDGTSGGGGGIGGGGLVALLTSRLHAVFVLLAL